MRTVYFYTNEQVLSKGRGVDAKSLAIALRMQSSSTLSDGWLLGLEIFWEKQNTVHFEGTTFWGHGVTLEGMALTIDGMAWCHAKSA